MKLEAPYINPINFSSGVAELEAASYRSVSKLKCQEFKTNDYLQFIVYFEKDEATKIDIRLNGTAIETAHTFSNAVQEIWESTCIKGYRRFNKGYIIFRCKLKDVGINDKENSVFSVYLYNSSAECILTSNNIYTNNGNTTSHLLKYSNTYDNSVCDFSLLTGLFEYRFNGLFYKTEFGVDAEVFAGANSNEVVSYKTNEQYILNIGGQDFIDLTEERKIRHILGCNVKIIDGVEFELTPDVNIESADLFRRAGRSVDITLTRKQYQQSVMQVTSGTCETITTNRPVTYDTTAFTLSVDPAELTQITVTDSNNRTTLNKTLIDSKDIVRVDFGINQNLDSNRTIDIELKDSVTKKTISIIQKYSGLLFGDAITGKNLILRKLPDPLPDPLPD